VDRLSRLCAAKCDLQTFTGKVLVLSPSRRLDPFCILFARGASGFIRIDQKKEEIWFYFLFRCQPSKVDTSAETVGGEHGRSRHRTGKWVGTAGIAFPVSGQCVVRHDVRIDGIVSAALKAA
jgi:hypothetical protein